MFAYANPDQKQKQQSKAKESMPYQNKNFSTTPCFALKITENPTEIVQHQN